MTLALFSHQALYAKPLPIWLHPAFAAEMASAFIGGTALEEGSLHISLEVLVLVVQRMLLEGGCAHKLPHAERAALNSACALLDGSKLLAHKLALASAHPGQQRLYLSRILKSLDGLDPGGIVLLPCAISQCPVMFVVSRFATPHQDRASFAVVSCDPETLEHHRSRAEPPKIRFETSLELRDVRLDRIKDEAFWAVAWYAATADGSGKLSPHKIFYQLLLSFLAEDSLEQAILRDDGEERVPLELRTPQRSSSSHYGCARQTLEHLLRIFGVGRPQRKRISLLVRLQMFDMVRHDLGFVQVVSPAERSIVNIACRQLAYKASKLSAAASTPVAATSTAAASSSATAAPSTENTGWQMDGAADDGVAEGGLSLSELSEVRTRIEALRVTLRGVPGAAPSSIEPPPLILSEADLHLGRPSLAMLLGDGSAGRLLLPPAGVRGTQAEHQLGGDEGARVDASPAAPPLSSAARAVREAWQQEAAGEISAQERQRRIALAYQEPTNGDAAAGLERTPEELLDKVEVLGLYFAAAWCPACRSTTPMVASAYKYPPSQELNPRPAAPCLCCLL